MSELQNLAQPFIKQIIQHMETNPTDWHTIEESPDRAALFTLVDGIGYIKAIFYKNECGHPCHEIRILNIEPECFHSFRHDPETKEPYRKQTSTGALFSALKII